jgi:hypothetical protein
MSAHLHRTWDAPQLLPIGQPEAAETQAPMLQEPPSPVSTVTTYWPGAGADEIVSSSQNGLPW